MSVKVPYEYVDSELSSISFSVFEEMKETGELCDVILKVEQHIFTAHRLVLVSRVPYFRAMFNNQFSESYKDVVSMEDVDPSALGCLINFAYSGRLLITSENVEKLLSTSIYLQFNSAIDGCFQFLLKTIGFSTVLMIRTFAETTSNAYAIDTVDQYIRENFQDFTTSETFLSLPFRMLNELLEREDLFVYSEETVFDAVMRWVEVNESVRGTHLSDLLHSVRIHLLSAQYLATQIDSVKRILLSCHCEDILDDIQHLFSMPERQTSPHCFRTRERCCKKKNHLKCTKIMGSGMYCICQIYNSSFFSKESDVLMYYDCIQRTWSTLCNDLRQLPNFLFGDYTICKEEDLSFMSNSYIVTLCLKTLECTLVEGDFNIPAGAEAILHNLDVYFFGGTVINEASVHLGSDDSKNVRCFSPNSDTSCIVGKMLEDRQGHGVASVGDAIYICGGRRTVFHDAGFTFYVHCSGEVFYPESGQCLKISSMIEPRYNHICAALNGLVYSFGGLTSDTHVHLADDDDNDIPDFGRTTSAEVYNPATDQWCSIAPMRILTYFLPPALYGGELYAVKSIGIGSFPVEVYDPNKDEWSSGQSISCLKSRHVAILVTNTASRCSLL